MTINTSIPIYTPDGKSAGCYVWSNSSDVEWIIVKISKAERNYKDLDTNDAIREMALDIFIQMKNGD